MYVTHLAAVEKLRDRPEQGTGSPMVGEGDIYIYIYTVCVSSKEVSLRNFRVTEF